MQKNITDYSLRSAQRVKTSMDERCKDQQDALSIFKSDKLIHIGTSAFSQKEANKKRENVN